MDHANVDESVIINCVNVNVKPGQNRFYLIWEQRHRFQLFYSDNVGDNPSYS